MRYCSKNPVPKQFLHCMCISKLFWVREQKKVGNRCRSQKKVKSNTCLLQCYTSSVPKKKSHCRKKLFAHLLSIFMKKCIIIGLLIDLFSIFSIFFSFCLKLLDSVYFSVLIMWSIFFSLKLLKSGQ